MNESLDLRKRILKMREVNNLKVISDNISKEDLNHNSNQPLKKNQSKVNFYKYKNQPFTDKKKTYQVERMLDKSFSNFIKENETNVGNCQDLTLEDNQIEKIENELIKKNDERFKVLAVKFNESVEVILELTRRIELLEKSSGLKNPNIKIKLEKQYINSIGSKNFKLITIVTLIILFFIGLFNLPTDRIVLENIINEIKPLIRDGN